MTYDKKKSPMSAHELMLRQQAYNSAVTSVELSGLTVTPEYEVIAQRFIAGEIDMSEFTALVHELSKR